MSAPQAGISGRWRRVDGEAQFSSALPSLRRSEVALGTPVGRKMAVGFAVDNREAWLLSYSLGLVGGAGGSLSRLGHFGRSQAEGPAGCRESVPAAAVARAAPQGGRARVPETARVHYMSL